MQQVNSQDTDTVVWYRQFWPWFIMVPPFCAIVGSMITIWLAVSNPPQLAVEDYSRIEEINARNVQLTSKAVELGLTAEARLLKLDGSDNRDVKVVLSSDTTEAAEIPSELLLRLTHATKPEFDRESLLVLDSSSGQPVYRGTVEARAAKYTIQLEDLAGTWRLTSELYGNAESVAF